jgi:hypothetical protein
MTRNKAKLQLGVVDGKSETRQEQAANDFVVVKAKKAKANFYGAIGQKKKKKGATRTPHLALVHAQRGGFQTG